ncbi:aldo/keto reductase [Croceivirga thetidis]|uniref:Aldo/keto reductase n=1 Tax=Croceivirga thetidis TaxID=2721623 RepID=A0ABX1GNA6_9FLAO|nr:aldo/keto reductase [Croceivirga thetidis]NKI31400.1 aldo/keto reductase [Croceivirga thetidis]
MKNNKTFSRIIAGTMTWGSWGKKLSTKEMLELMNYCVSIGITSFDHADIYGDYGNEEEFGKAFNSSAISREEIQIISKCGIQMTNGRPNRVAHYQYDSEYIIWSCERSLSMLQTEYLDLLLLHRPSPLMHPNEVAKAIQKLTKEGKIKSFGVSNFSPSQIAMLEKDIAVQANQVEYSLTHLNPMYDGTFDDCIANERMAMAWSPLGSYFREDGEVTKRIKKVMDELVEKYQCNESQLLLAFMMKHPANIFAVVGTSQKARLKESLEAASIALEHQDWFHLLEASHGHQVP